MTKSPPDRAAALAALAALLGALECDARVIVEEEEGGKRLASLVVPAQGGGDAGGVPPEPRRPAEPRPDPPKCPSHPLKILLLDVLTDAHPARLTAPQIVAEIEGRGKSWSERHVARFLKELEADGLIDNDRDQRGQGYGFR